MSGKKNILRTNHYPWIPRDSWGHVNLETRWNIKACIFCNAETTKIEIGLDATGSEGGKVHPLATPFLPLRGRGNLFVPRMRCISSLSVFFHAEICLDRAKRHSHENLYSKFHPESQQTVHHNQAHLRCDLPRYHIRQEQIKERK